MPDVQELLTIRDDAVRKWGTQLAFIQAPDAPVPATFIDATTHEPVLPDDALQLGYITTDGISQEDSVSVENTPMLQSLEPVRYDLTGIEKTLTVAFGEDNAFVQALWHAVPFEEFPAEAYGPWRFSDGEITEYPWFRFGVIMQDGVGAQARYRFEYAYRAIVTAKTARTLNRSDAESFGFTFGLAKDPTVKRSFERIQDGPVYHPAA